LQCPKCSTSFLKSSGCNMLTCRCGYQMCYLCRHDLTSIGYSHFCPHFRITPAQDCEECDKCFLYRNENEDEVARIAGRRAAEEWDERNRSGRRPAGWQENIPTVERKCFLLPILSSIWIRTLRFSLWSPLGDSFGQIVGGHCWILFWASIRFLNCFVSYKYGLWTLCYCISVRKLLAMLCNSVLWLHLHWCGSFRFSVSFIFYHVEWMYILLMVIWLWSAKKTWIQNQNQTSGE